MKQKIVIKHIAQIFLDSNLAFGWKRLGGIVNDNGVNFAELKPCEAVMFINRQKNRIKIAFNNDTLIYRRFEDRIPLEALRTVGEMIGIDIKIGKTLQELITEKWNSY